MNNVSAEISYPKLHIDYLICSVSTFFYARPAFPSSGRKASG